MQHITNEEVIVTQSLMSPKSVDTCSAVVRFYQAYGKRWSFISYGIVCVIKDNDLKSFYVRVFDLINRQIVLNQELYMEMNYSEELPLFHVLQADVGPVGFSFACMNEAIAIEKKIKSLIRNMKKKIDEGKEKTQIKNTYEVVLPQTTAITTTDPPKSTKTDIVSGMFKKKNKQRKLQKITPNDISAPSNFRHINHLGFDNEVKFEESEDDIIKQIFLLIGCEDRLHLPEEKKFVLDYIKKNGSLEEAKSQLITFNQSKSTTNNQAPVGVGSGVYPPQNAMSNFKGPAGISSPNSIAVSGPVLIRNPVPPPPAIQPRPPVPMPNRAPSMPVRPPPPPPPLPPGGFTGSSIKGVQPPPPPPLQRPSISPMPMEDSGKAMPPPPPVLPNLTASGDDPVSPDKSGSVFDLQSQIKSFKMGNLRKTTPNEGVQETAQTTPKAESKGDLLQSLANAMELRRKFMMNADKADKSSDDSESDDDDWED